MLENKPNITEQEIEALKYLERDFNQSYQQMRHYDAQIFDILKFMFTGYTGLIGIALGLYQFGLNESKDLSLPAIAALVVGLIVGVFMYALVIRNRVYFVQVARYINEQRGFFLRFKPMGFENNSKMYMNSKKPPFYNWRSSQSWFSNIIALLNSILFGALIYITFNSNNSLWVILGVSFLVFCILQLVIAIKYLVSREYKSAENVVFGKENDVNLN